jgi:hypothetical protein
VGKGDMGDPNVCISVTIDAVTEKVLKYILACEYTP